VDRVFVDRLGQGQVAGVDRGQHPAQVEEAVGVLGPDVTGGGGIVRLAVDDQEVQRGGDRVAGLLKGEPQVAGGLGEIRVPDGLFPADFAACLDPSARRRWS